MRFDDALSIVLKWEGGFSNDPRDPGGATNLGITQKTLSDWYERPATVDELRFLTPTAVVPLYEERYWQACFCGELPHGVDLLVFDCAVNQGPGRAKRLLQRALGVRDDGVLGSMTMTSALRHDRVSLIDELVARRAVHYASLRADFHLGWFRRLTAIHRKALE